MKIRGEVVGELKYKCRAVDDGLAQRVCLAEIEISAEELAKQMGEDEMLELMKAKKGITIYGKPLKEVLDIMDRNYEPPTCTCPTQHFHSTPGTELKCLSCGKLLPAKPELPEELRELIVGYGEDKLAEGLCQVQAKINEIIRYLRKEVNKCMN